MSAIRGVMSTLLFLNRRYCFREQKFFVQFNMISVKVSIYMGITHISYLYQYFMCAILYGRIKLKHRLPMQNKFSQEIPYQLCFKL